MEEYKNEAEQKRKIEERKDRRMWTVVKVIAWIICLMPGMWLLLDHYKDGRLEIYLDYRAEDAVIYATKYTWWGLGQDKHYEIRTIRDQWHIRERNTNEKWSPIYNFAIFSHKSYKIGNPTYYGDDY